MEKVRFKYLNNIGPINVDDEEIKDARFKTSFKTQIGTDEVEISIRYPELRIFSWNEKQGITSMRLYVIDENNIHVNKKVRISLMNKISFNYD